MAKSGGHDEEKASLELVGWMDSGYNGEQEMEPLRPGEKLVARTSIPSRSPRVKEIESTDLDGQGQCPRRLHYFRRVMRTGFPHILSSGIREVVCGSKICILMVMVPVTILGVHFQLGRAFYLGISESRSLLHKTVKAVPISRIEEFMSIDKPEDSRLSYKARANESQATGTARICNECTLQHRADQSGSLKLPGPLNRAPPSTETSAFHIPVSYWSQGYIFAASLLAIAPLAERLGYVTEQLAEFTGATVGGLLNATFGNATEMIISILALRQNMIRVVQLSLLGSILSNMLLVLGCAFFFGGVKHNDKKEQNFNKAAALVSSSLLLMAVMGLVFPAVLHATHTEIHDGSSELTLSRFSSCIMLVAYGCYLYFQLKSHKELYDDPKEDKDGESEECEEEESTLGFWGSIFWLGVLTIFISILSDCLVDAIQGASEMWDVPVAFISVIILPIVGNAAEHASAVMFALKDKLDISLGVAIGSSTQIAMFVIPFCVVIGWIMGKDMDLNFQLFETATLFITVLVVAYMLQEGTSNYFKGLMLILCYLIVGASFFVHVDNTGQPGN